MPTPVPSRGGWWAGRDCPLMAAGLEVGCWPGAGRLGSCRGLSGLVRGPCPDNPLAAGLHPLGRPTATRTAGMARAGVPGQKCSRVLARRARRCAWWHAWRRGAPVRGVGLRWWAPEGVPTVGRLLGGPRQPGPSHPPTSARSGVTGTCGGIYRDGPGSWLVASAALNPTPPNPPP